MDGHLAEIGLIVGLILLNGFFAAAEIALVAARRHALQAAAEDGSAGAREALELTKDPSTFLAAIQVGITLAGFLASATAAVSLAELVRGLFEEAGLRLPAGVASGLSVLIVTLVISYFTLVFGELVPKRVGLHRAVAVATRAAKPVRWMATLAAPIVWVLSRSTDAVARLFGVRPEDRASVTEDEIRLLVAEQTSLMDEEKRMIDEIFDLGDTVAREIMVPRVDVRMVEDTETVAEAMEVFRESGFSRLPVFREDPDTVVGVLLLKDLVQAGISLIAGDPVADHMRDAVFVPETKNVLELMKEMQATRTALVVVVDEYGGTAGILTLEDIVEEVVGEIIDEYDTEERYIVQVAETSWVVDGRCPVEDAAQVLGLALPESEEYDTVAGWVLSELGRIPVPGEALEFDGATIRVLTVRRRRIARLRVEKPAPSQDRAAAAPQEGASSDE